MHEPGFERSLAVVIGIDAYGHGVPPLASARRDAERLAALLRDGHGYEVRAFLDTDARRERLTRLLADELPAELGPDDRLLFYFAGHGIAMDGDDGPSGFLLPQDARRSEESSWLRMPFVHDSLLALECRHLLVILDACFAGAFRWSSTRELVRLPPVIHRERFDRFLSSPAWQVISSASDDQKALDELVAGPLGTRGAEGTHSPFALALFEALGGAGDVVPVNGGDGVITATELYLYLEDRLQPETMRRGLRQTPRLWPLKKHEKGEYIFLTPGREPDLPPAPPLSTENNPYRGLAAYEPGDADLFFGREEMVAELRTRVEREPLTVVLGASGTGKSSVVKAGLIPRLEKAGWHVLPVVRPGPEPLHALRRAADTLDTMNAALTDDAEASYAAVRDCCVRSAAPRLLLVIDQLEELVTQAKDPADAERMLELIARMIADCGDALRVVLTLRSDFEPQFAGGPLRDRWRGARCVVRPLTQDELRQIIEEPASRRVLYFEPSSLVDDLINEVIATPGGLPLLSFALSEMYLHYLGRRSDRRAITTEDYDAVGGVVGALRARGNAEFDALDDAHRATLRRVMLRMVALGEGEAVRRRVWRSELDYGDGDENARVTAVVGRLGAARLIVEDREDDEAFVEPAHDALVGAWDRLLGWIREANRSAVYDLRFQRRLAEAAREWARSPDPKLRGALLWADGVRSRLLAPLLRDGVDWLNRDERAFARASVRSRRRGRLTVLATAVLVIGLALGVTAAAILATRGRRDARDQAAFTRVAVLANGIRPLLAPSNTEDPELPLLLAAEGIRLLTQTRDQRRSADMENAVRQLSARLGGFGLPGYMQPVPRQTNTEGWGHFTADGRWLITGNIDESHAFVWDLHAPWPAAAHIRIDSITAISPDASPIASVGHWLVLARTVGDSARLEAWDTRAASVSGLGGLRILLDTVAPLTRITGSADGRAAIAWGEPAMGEVAPVARVDLSGERPVLVALLPGDDVEPPIHVPTGTAGEAVAGSDPGGWVATLDEPGPESPSSVLRVRTLAAERALLLESPVWFTKAIASPDGRWLLVLGWGASHRLWDVQALKAGAAEPPAPASAAQSGIEDTGPPAMLADSLELPAIGGGQTPVAEHVSPDGRWLVVRFGYNAFEMCSYSTGLRLVDLGAPDPIATFAPLPDVGGGRCPSLHFSADGRWLATDTLLWDLTALVPSAQGFWLPGEAVAFEADSFVVARSPVPGPDEELPEGTPIRVSRVPLAAEALIERACRVAGRNLLRHEWRSHFPGEPYRAVCPALPLPPDDSATVYR